MDEHGLPIVGTGVDYTKVPALEHKNTLVFLNAFVTQTAQFLNRFSSACEERLGDLNLRIQRLDISLNILEAKLSSIPDLDGVVGDEYKPPEAVASAGNAPASSHQGPPPSSSSTAAATTAAPPPASSAATVSDQPAPPLQPQPEEPASSGRKKAKDDPRYARFFKMKRLGVNPLQIQMEMRNHGLNPDILEDEDAELPDGDPGAGKVGAGAGRDSDDESGASSSSSEASDDSFESD